MSKYKLTFENYVIREDGARIPIYEKDDLPNTNPDFIEYKDWLVSGGIPDQPDPDTEPVPYEVRLWQARIILHEMGLLTRVEFLLENLEEPLKTRARNIWEYAGTVERDNGIVLQLAQAIPLTSAELDRLFIAANKIKG